MSRRHLLLLGWCWPFLTAAAGVSLVASGYYLGDRETFFLFLLGLFGSPAVGWTVSGWLPRGWSNELRSGTAVALSIPLVCCQMVLAVVTFVVGTCFTGNGWVE